MAAKEVTAEMDIKLRRSNVHDKFSPMRKRNQVKDAILTKAKEVDINASMDSQTRMQKSLIGRFQLNDGSRNKGANPHASHTSTLGTSQKSMGPKNMHEIKEANENVKDVMYQMLYDDQKYNLSAKKKEMMEQKGSPEINKRAQAIEEMKQALKKE